MSMSSDSILTQRLSPAPDARRNERRFLSNSIKGFRMSFHILTLPSIECSPLLCYTTYRLERERRHCARSGASSNPAAPYTCLISEDRNPHTMASWPVYFNQVTV